MIAARRLGFTLAALTLVLDQIVKWWVMGPLALPLRQQIEMVPFFRLTWAENRGVSLGLFSAESDAGRWALVAMTAAIAVAVSVWMTREARKGDLIGLGLVLGGAIGNIIDRVRFGYVADYADLHFGDFRPFFIFNLADAAISIGVLIILAHALLSGEKPSGAEPGQPANSASES